MSASKEDGRNFLQQFILELDTEEQENKNKKSVWTSTQLHISTDIVFTML